MNIGNLCLVKKYHWLLFQQKKQPSLLPDYIPPSYYCFPATYSDDSWYHSENNLIVFLEEEGKLKKVLTADGKIGWTWFDESYNDCFEELKAEP